MMDLEDQNSASKSVQDNEEMTTPPRFDNGNQSKVESSNGSSPPGDNSSNNNLEDVKGRGIEIKGVEDYSTPVVKSSPTTKGFGLKKWKRMKRDARRQDGDSSVNSGKLLKRGLAGEVANLERPVNFSAGRIQKSDGSVSSTNAVFRNNRVLVDGFGVTGESGSIGLIFNAVSESENSEDRSSRSSTAASAPKARYESPVLLGYSSDKHWLRSLSGKSLSTSAQKPHQEKGRAETSKKPRGERVKIEKENSHSSMESDSRSSNFLFMQGNYATSNGTKGERSMIYDGESSDEAQDRERPIGEELRAGLERGNDRESENVSQEDLVAESPWEVKKEKSENHDSSTDHNPLMESIFSFQSAQEALASEIEKFKEIGKDVIFGCSLEDVGIPSDFPRPSTSVLSQHQDGAQHSINSLESEVLSLKQNIFLLQNKVQKAADLLKSKEARVAELEAILGSSSKSEAETTESEFEDLFRQKIEAEVQYLTISTTAQKLRSAAVDQLTLLEEQKTLASEQEQMLHVLGDAEAKAALLKTQAEKLESYCEDLASTDEKLKLQKKVCKYSLCFFVQLVLLAVVIGLFLMLISPDHAELVPT